MRKKVETMMKTVHFVPGYFLDPVHRISVILVGAGGNGSQMLSSLARMDHALRQLRHPGLAVRVYDPDVVEAPNVGRQLFTAGDLGRNKAECLVSRFNRMYGTDWEAEPEAYRCKCTANIIITCVDSVKCRKEVGAFLSRVRRNQSKSGRTLNEHSWFYWLDLGNGQRTGQAILGSACIPQPDSSEYRTVETLPLMTEQFDLSRVRDADSGPSCSLAEALTKQDLFINSALSQISASLLWSVLTDAAIDARGFFINLDTYRVSPMPLISAEL